MDAVPATMLMFREPPQRRSRYYASGAPLVCAACAQPFPEVELHRECRRGADDRYYCDRACEAHARHGLRRLRVAS
jgi:hypothetical protein